MFKRLIFLTSFILVLALVGANVALGSVVDIRIATGDDDVEERLQEDRNGDLDMGSSDLEFPYEDFDPLGDPQRVSMRFVNVGIPQGAQITSAYLEFEVDNLKGGTAPVNVIIDGELTPDAAPFVDVSFNVSNRPSWTTEVVKWSVPNWTEQNVKYQTPDISVLVQEIVNQDGWAYGNAMVYTVQDDPENPSEGVREAESYDGEADAAPLLHVEFISKVAMQPVPAEGAIEVDAMTLEWTPADVAVSNKVYLSTDETIDESDLAGETAVALIAPAIEPGTTYYWRVDAVDADGNVIEGSLWSFSTLALEAHFPSPADGATEIKSGTILSWTPGKDVITHDVYFGTDPAALLPVSMMQMDTSFDPGAFEAAVTYYWRVDEFSVTGTNPGPVWSFKAFDPDVASEPDPANGAVDVDNMPVLSWTAGETASLHDVYFGTDADLVAAGDASVFQGQQTEIGFATAEALDRGITYYWKVDVSTGPSRGRVFHPGKVWSFRVVDRNTNNWAVTVAGDSPAYLDTFVEDGLYDIGALSGDITYEFVVLSNPDETEASMALIGRRQFGDTEAGLKYEQWNNTGTYGATIFGVVDLDYGVPTAPGEYTVLAFVSSEDAATTTLYVNGVQEGSVASAITLSGLVGIGYGAQGEDGSGSFDNFDGTIFGVAIYDEALSDDKIAKHSDSYFTPIAITDPNLLIYYDFESGEGITVLDRSGHGNHSLFMGNPEWATGIFGGGLAIEIEELDYIQTMAPLNIVTNTVTVAGWVKHDETPAGWSGILTHRGSDPGCFGLQHNGMETGAAELRYMWGPDTYWDVSTGLLIPNGEWYFAAIAVAPDQAKFYLNGVGADQTFTNVAEHVLTNFDSEIRVARDHADNRIMTCLIDEVRFYDKTLTDVEILKLMGSTSDVTAPGDIVQGVPNDGLMDGDNFGWPGAETPDLATDDDISTKFLHFKGELEPTGFQVEPASGPSIVTGLTLTTANDEAPRDPISYELSGSNDSIDGPYELIASGDIVDFAQETAWPRFTMNATPIMFENDVAYKYYQVMFPTVRDAASANSMQIAEVELLGVPAPVAHWTFDEGAGTVALDSSGNGNDGIFVGDPQWVAGVVGGALEFNGDDYLDCGNGPSLQIQDAITISFWFNVVAFENTWEAMLSKGDSAYRVSRGDGTGDATHFGISGTTGGGGNGWFNGNSIVTGGVWHHFAGTYDGAEGRIYIDGALDATTEATGQIDIETDGFWIGNNSQNPDRFLHGILDDVRLYNQALSQAEIRVAMKGPSAGEPVEPVPEPVEPVPEFEPFAEDFESYAAGSDLHGQDGWKGWDNTAGAGAPASDAFAASGLNSVEIIGSADLVHEFDVAGGMLEFSAMQYIPSGTSGTTYFILLNSYDDGANQDWSVQTSFDLAAGTIAFWHGGEATILYDQWVELKYIIDLDNNTVDKYYNGELIATDQWDDNVNGTLGAIDLFGNGASSVYYDDITIASL